MYDLIIIGGGPAGLTAGLYAARARLNLLLVERLAPGGQVLNTDWVDNYPGFPDGISGFELIDRMKNQAERFGLKIQNEEVLGIRLEDKKKIIIARNGEIETKSLILASGAIPKKIGIDGEDRLMGKGVSYCATCDGPFYRDQDVAVIGGGDTAVEEALFLTRFVQKSSLIHRRDKLRATKLLQEKALKEEKIEMVWDTIPLRILGQDGVEGIELKNVKTNEVSQKTVQGVFVFIGTTPNTDYIKDLIELDQNGFIITDGDMKTSVPGIFAAGDVRSKPWRQISTAVGEGATACFSVEKYLEDVWNA